MKKLEQMLLRQWQKPGCLSLVLLPLSILFALISSYRRQAYEAGWLKIQKLPVPVVIIGNINVGGTGKTPILIALANDLKNAGIHVGIISRGYRRSSTETLIVRTGDKTEQYGDEPVLIAQKTGLPVAVSSNRYQAGIRLMQHDPEIELILSDDGLQHYALGRDLELVTVNTQYEFGNRGLLPYGPLREPVSRIARADALIFTNAPKADWHPTLPDTHASHTVFISQLKTAEFYQLSQPQHKKTAADLAKQEAVTALTGIANPQNFFSTLEQMGIHPQKCIAFPDHYSYQPEDIPADCGTILLTEKDAVKIQPFASDNMWVLPVNATINPDLSEWVQKKLTLGKLTQNDD